jgi:hemoglobin
MKKSTVIAILEHRGIKVVGNTIKKDDIFKAIKALASDKDVVKEDVVLEDIGDGLTVTIPHIVFGFDFEHGYGADRDGNRGRDTWFIGEIVYDDPIHGVDADGNSVPLTPKDLKEVHKQLEKMAERMDISDASVKTVADDKSLYDRLGGIFAISAVVDHFSDALINNPIVGKDSKNPALAAWHTNSLDRLPGLKMMRTMWVCAAAGGPQGYVPTKPGKEKLGLEEAHRNLKITSEEFDEVAAELGRTLDHFNVPEKEKGEVLGAFAAHKGEVIEGSKE